MSAPAKPKRAPLSEALFGRLIFGLLGAGFATMLLIVAATLWLNTRSQQFSALVNHTYQVETHVADLRVLFERTEAARRGYLISGETFYRQVFDDTVRQIGPAIDELARLTLDNPAQRDRIISLRPQMQVLVQQMAASVELARTGDLEGARKLFLEETNGPQMTGIRTLLTDMQAEENRLLSMRNALQVSNAKLLTTVVIGAGALLALLALSSLMIMRRYARDLIRTQGELQVLNRGLEDAVKERTADLSRANEEIQRFAYIVSHDLRSPLVNVMGFTSELELATGPLKELVARAEATAPEILSREAKAAVDVDLPEAVGFIRASTQKMDRLINAILQLSRQGRRTLRPERLSIRKVVEAAETSMRHQLDERGVRIVVEGDPPELVSDRLAIEQVFSNLIENAVKYLKPGRPGLVKVRGRAQSGRAIYEIEDNGRGIDPKDHERIFELFRRSGQQDQPGEGIGLATVRALVYRLGGTITCESELDRGATFRLSLPLHLAPEQGMAA